jgi:hypothetical protein
VTQPRNSVKLPAPPATWRAGGEQPVEHGHRRPGRKRDATRVVDVGDEAIAAGDHCAAVDIEQREAGSAGLQHVEPGGLEDCAEVCRRVVAAMTDVPIERRHRPAWHRDDQQGARCQPPLRGY